MIHSLTIQRTLTYELTVEADSREEAERLARIQTRADDFPASSEDWEYIHPNGTRHYVQEGAR